VSTSNNSERKTVKVDVFEADIPTLQLFLHYINSDRTEEGFHYALKVMAEMADRIKELSQGKDNSYIEGKKENWKQAQLRRQLPFYG
jgi:hypothetical protein